MPKVLASLFQMLSNSTPSFRPPRSTFLPFFIRSAAFYKSFGSRRDDLAPCGLTSRFAHRLIHIPGEVRHRNAASVRWARMR